MESRFLSDLSQGLVLNKSGWDTRWFAPGSDPCRDGWRGVECRQPGELSCCTPLEASESGCLDACDGNRVITIDLTGAGGMYPEIGSPGRASYERATARCRGMGASVSCTGLPPNDCGAFQGPEGVSYRLSITDPNVCNKCPPKEELVSVVLFFVVLTVAGISAMTLYIYFVLKWPEALKRWGSTLTIIVGHVQVLTIIGGLRLELPRTLHYVLNFFDVFTLPDAACLFDEVRGLSPFWMLATISCAALLVLLLVMLGSRGYFEQRRKPALADAAEFAVSIILCVQLTSAWRIIASVIISFLSNATQLSNFGLPIIAFVLSVLLFLTHVILIVRYTSMVIAFKRGEDTREWRLGGRAISPRRLEAQARYLTVRFGAHARRWQLVLWLRQLTLFFISLLLDMLSDFMHASGLEREVDPVRYAFAAAAMATLLIFWLVHSRTQPYAHHTASNPDLFRTLS